MAPPSKRRDPEPMWCCYEEADRVGKKILATGNGRCNLSNADIMSDDYNRPEFE